MKYYETLSGILPFNQINDLFWYSVKPVSGGQDKWHYWLVSARNKENFPPKVLAAFSEIYKTGWCIACKKSFSWLMADWIFAQDK